MNSRTVQETGHMRQLALIPEIFPDLAPDANGEHGEIFTRKWVVELILDLVGYTTERDLAGLAAVRRPVEPAHFSVRW